jgi:PKD repeat protein
MNEMNAKTTAVTCLIISLLLTPMIMITITTPILAVPQPSHQFYGTVTIAGEPAPDGTLIEAVINTTVYATTTTLDGKYGYTPVFKVPADDPDTPQKEGGKDGDIVHFYAARTYATNYTFASGATTQLDLAITAPTAYAYFTADVTNGTEPLTVTFMDQSMYFDTITSRTWVFGDANITTTGVANITHTYIQNGTYTVSLTVNGTQAGQNITATETKTDYITVYDSKPKAEFYATPTSGTAPLTVNFTDNSTSYDGITSWLWGFGDESNSTEQNPTHNYTTAGRYNVTLTITEQDGDTSTIIKENYITVQPTAPIVEIISPTTSNPIYTKQGQIIPITFNYTELNPLNWTIKVNTIIELTNTTAITLGAGIQTVNITIPQNAPDGKYNLTITMFNTYNLSTPVTQTNAIIVDSTPPTVTIIIPSEGALVNAKTIWINGTITELNKGQLKPNINNTNFELASWDSTTGQFAFQNKTTIPDGLLSIKVNFTDLPGNIGTDTVTFTQDTTPPSIYPPYQDPPGQTVQANVTVNVDPGQNITIRVNVTDTLSGIKQVMLTYNTSATEWANITMLKTTGNEYTATIPSSQLSIGTTVTYYITATDNTNNTAKTPTNGIYFQYHVVPEFSNFAVLLLILAIGTTLAIAASKTTKRKSPPLK